MLAQPQALNPGFEAPHGHGGTYRGGRGRRVKNPRQHRDQPGRWGPREFQEGNKLGVFVRDDAI